jgi:Lon-like protease
VSDSENTAADEPDESAASGEDEPRPRRKWAIRSAVGSLFVGLAIGIVSQFINLPYFIISPGSTLSVNNYIDVPADKSYPPDGKVLMVTVRVAQAHPLDMVWAWITPHTEIVKQKELIGDASPKQYFEANENFMENSKLTAEYVAMKRAGYNVDIVGDGAGVAVLADNAPSQGKLNAGDTIVGLNGNKIVRADQLTSGLRAIAPQTTVRLDVISPSGESRSVELVTAARPDDPSASYVGVSVQTKNPRLSTPFPIDLKTEQIGGPSAGLAFTLTALDQLTPGNLTGGTKIAVTGTISADGSVGEVGGVEQKTAAVEKSGAKVFLVPSSEAEEARKVAGSKLRVVGINTLDEALAALAANGGDTSGVPVAR